MTDLLDSDDFIELMRAYRHATDRDYSYSEGIALADVKNYIRIHCVVPEEKDEGVPW